MSHLIIANDLAFPRSEKQISYLHPPSYNLLQSLYQSGPRDPSRRRCCHHRLGLRWALPIRQGRGEVWIYANGRGQVCATWHGAENHNCGEESRGVEGQKIEALLYLISTHSHTHHLIFPQPFSLAVAIVSSSTPSAIFMLCIFALAKLLQLTCCRARYKLC